MSVEAEVVRAPGVLWRCTQCGKRNRGEDVKGRFPGSTLSMTRFCSHCGERTEQEKVRRS
jgi:DNA-directed RNA polymerase subunit RPC12/RpoP